MSFQGDGWLQLNMVAWLTNDNISPIPWEITPTVCLSIKAGAYALIGGGLPGWWTIDLKIANTANHTLLGEILPLKDNNKTFFKDSQLTNNENFLRTWGQVVYSP